MERKGIRHEKRKYRKKIRKKEREREGEREKERLENKTQRKKEKESKQITSIPGSLLCLPCSATREAKEKTWDRGQVKISRGTDH